MGQRNATSSLTTGTQLQDWPNLIERLQAIAVKTRLAEAQAEAKRRTFQAGQLLREARTEVFEAEQRALVADARIRSAREQSSALLKLANDRVRQTEERARVAEDLLLQFQGSTKGEFFMMTEDELMPKLPARPLRAASSSR
jgi:hypothetical protein